MTRPGSDSAQCNEESTVSHKQQSVIHTVLTQLVLLYRSEMCFFSIDVKYQKPNTAGQNKSNNTSVNEGKILGKLIMAGGDSQHT